MPTTKKPTRKTTQLDRIEKLLHKVEASVAVIRSGATPAQDLGLKAVETIKAGDWVRITGDPGNGSPHRWLDIVRVKSIDGEWAIIASDAPSSGSRSILKRKLEKLSKDEIAAQEQAHVPKFGDIVEYEGADDWRVAMDVPTPSGSGSNYALSKINHARIAWAKRSEFRIIDPQP